MVNLKVGLSGSLLEITTVAVEKAALIGVKSMEKEADDSGARLPVGLEISGMRAGQSEVGNHGVLSATIAEDEITSDIGCAAVDISNKGSVVRIGCGVGVVGDVADNGVIAGALDDEFRTDAIGENGEGEVGVVWVATRNGDIGELQATVGGLEIDIHRERSVGVGVHRHHGEGIDGEGRIAAGRLSGELKGFTAYAQEIETVSGRAPNRGGRKDGPIQGVGNGGAIGDLLIGRGFIEPALDDKLSVGDATADDRKGQAQ